MKKILSWVTAIIVIPALIILAVGLIIAPIMAIDYFGTKSSCPKYGREVGYQVKFVDNVPYYWSCQVKTPSGWIDYSNIQSISLGEVK